MITGAAVSLKMAPQLELVWVRGSRIGGLLADTFNSVQRQRWSLMTILYLSVRSLRAVDWVR